MRRPLLASVFLLAACGGATAHPPEPALVTTPKPTTPPAAKNEERPSPPPATAETQAPTEAATPSDLRAANKVSLDLLKKKKGNVMLSGASLRQALGAVYLGAKGDTAREMATALGFDTDPKKAAANAQADLATWKTTGREGAEISVANRLWIDKTFPLKPEYATQAAATYEAVPENLDFKSEPEDARRRINGWVSQKTQDKISELMPKGSLDKDTRFVVTNAIYFKGRWATPFRKDGTKDEAFKVDGKKPVNLPTMHATDTYRYVAKDGVKAIELPYIAEGGLSMLVVLPDAADGLAKVEEKLTAETLDAWTSALLTTRVEVALPKFTFAWGGSTKSMLQELGMKTAFSDKADFGNVAEGKLIVSDAFHQTWIAVDEQGTEAAAATGVAMRTTSMFVGQPTPFKADHPFLFFVRKNGHVLFAGRVTNPRP